MNPRHRLGFALPLLAVWLAAPSAAQCSTQDYRGRVVSVDLAQGRFEASNNLVPGSFTYVVDAQTDFRGAAGSLAGIQVGFDVDIRWCFPSSPRLVLRVTSGVPATPPAAALVVDLADALGQEIVPVTRVFGDDASEGLAGFQGQGVAFGDMNGDGLADALMRGGRSEVNASGALVVVYGRPGLAGALVDLDTNGAVSAAGETRIHPTAAFQALGSALGCGDLDGDGIDDLILGQSGGVQVVFGALDLAGRSIDLDPAQTAPDQYRLLTGDSPAAVAAGDLNGDGHDDLIVDGRARGLFVVYGGSGLRGTTRDVRTGSGPVPGITRILPTQAVSSLACGDVNADGFEDLVLGEQSSINPTFVSAFVVYGSEALVGTLVDLATNPATGVPRETRVTGHSLAAVACADHNGDGYDDVLLATPDVTGPGDNFAVGEVSVIYGAATLPGTALSLLTGAVNPNETRITGREEFGEFGRSLAAADVDGDGKADLLMGAPGSVPFGSLPETNVRSDGALYGLRGRLGRNGTWLIDPREVADIYVFAAEEGDRLGSVVAAGGDMDRDGLPEWAASASAGTNPFLGPHTFSGYAALPFLHGITLPAITRVRRASRAGDGPGGAVVPPTDFGPVVRVQVDYSDQDVTGTSWTTVTLARAGLPTTANVVWILSTTRVGWQQAEVTLRYTDAEVAGLAEARLQVLLGDTPSGPFHPVPTRVHPDRNSVTARVDRLGTFVLVEGERMHPHVPPTRLRFR